MSSNLLTSELDTIPQLQMKKLLLKVLEQILQATIAQSHSAHKWQAWDLRTTRPRAHVPSSTLSCVNWHYTFCSHLNAGFMVQRRNSTHLKTQVLHNTNGAQIIQVEHIKVPLGPMLTVKFTVSKGFAGISEKLVLPRSSEELLHECQKIILTRISWKIQIIVFLFGFQ